MKKKSLIILSVHLTIMSERTIGELEDMSIRTYGNEMQRKVLKK